MSQKKHRLWLHLKASMGHLKLRKVCCRDKALKINAGEKSRSSRLFSITIVNNTYIFIAKLTTKKRSSLASMLSNKSIFFYPGIVVAAAWTLLNIVKIVSYAE